VAVPWGVGVPFRRLIIAWAIAIAALAFPAAGLLLYAVALFHRHARTMRCVPTARAGLEWAASRTPTGSVCLIVPAHNEQDVVGTLIDSLRSQDYPRLSVVLSLDRCTDDTRAAAERHIAGDPRFHIHAVDTCPDDWAGKVHAIWSAVQGVESARQADYLLFADADTIFDQRCVSACVAYLEERRLDLFSLLSTLTTERWFEKIVQPVAAMELVYQFPLTRCNAPDARRPFANGQFMLFRADAYRKVGGHAAVKDELLEDIALARRVTELGLAPGVALADGLLRCRMYPDWQAFRRGWKRIYTESAKRRSSRLRRSAWRVRTLGAILPACTIALAVLSAAALAARPEGLDPGAPRFGLMLAVAALAAWWWALARIYATGGSPRWAVFAAPWGFWSVGAILAEAARDLRRGIPTLWAGRAYRRPDRS
jgi:glycosyltransferase involved in cell wall biosynthesis